MKKSPAQLQREIDDALARRTKDRQIVDAIASGDREKAARLYGTWTSSYSNEDLDRVSGLASRLTDVDREEGRTAPPVGFSSSRIKQAKQVVSDANNYGALQQGLGRRR